MRARLAIRDRPQDSPDVAAAKAKLRLAAQAAAVDPIGGFGRLVRSTPWVSVGAALLLGAVAGFFPGARRGLRLGAGHALRLGAVSASVWPRSSRPFRKR